MVFIFVFLAFSKEMEIDNEFQCQQHFQQFNQNDIL